MRGKKLAVAGCSLRTSTVHAPLRQRLKQLMEGCAATGACIARIEDGELVWTDAFGFADVATEERDDSI